MSPPSTSRLRRCPTRARWSLTEPWSATSINSSVFPFQLIGVGSPEKRPFGRGAAVDRHGEYVDVGVPLVADRPRVGDPPSVGREARELGHALPACQTTGPPATGGHHPDVAVELAVVAPGVAVGGERDRGAGGWEGRT